MPSNYTIAAIAKRKASLVGKPVDETQPPSPLPETLPAGTRLVSGYAMRGVWALPQGALLDDGEYNAPLRTCDGTPQGPGCHFPETIDWPSYYAALRSQSTAPPEKWQPKIGERIVSDTGWTGVYRGEDPHSGFSMVRRDDGVTGTGPDDSFTIWNHGLRPLPAQQPADPEPEKVEAINAETLAADLKFPNSKFPKRKPNYAEWAAAEDARHAAALAQHLADFDRPRRFGKMGGLDKYGQKLSLRGWPDQGDET
jgi:hypothetical protein